MMTKMWLPGLGTVPCNPANPFRTAGKWERDRNERTDTLCVNDQLYTLKRWGQKGWQNIDTIFFTQATTRSLALCHCVVACTGDINLDLVSRTPLGIWGIQNIGPLGNKGFRACHRNPSNLKWKNKQYMKYLQNMVESRDSYPRDLLFPWILLTSVLGIDSSELLLPTASF